MRNFQSRTMDYVFPLQKGAVKELHWLNGYFLYSKQHDVYDADGRFHAEPNVTKIHGADHGKDHRTAGAEVSLQTGRNHEAGVTASVAPSEQTSSPGIRPLT